MPSSLRFHPNETPYRTKYFEGGRVYTFPSLKQMNCFSKMVKNIIDLYANGDILYDGNDKPILKVEDAVDFMYRARYKGYGEN